MPRRRGRAAIHPCAGGCGRPARHWAYQHTAGDAERVSRKGHPYSDNLDDYAPMCQSCHFALDGVMAKAMSDPATALKMRETGKRNAATYAKRLKEDPEFAAIRREKSRSVALNKTRRCECGRVFSPAHLGTHQKHSGHQTWTAVS